MFSIISTEFIKLKRSKMLFLATMASFLPAMIKYLQSVLGKSHASVSWEWFLAEGQELMFLSVFTTVVFVSSFVFSMEYHYNTASYVFTSNTSKVNIFIAKIISVLVVIILLFFVLALSQLIFGFLALKVGIPSTLFHKFIKVMVWYILSYFLVSAIVIMIAILIKRFIVSVVIVLGYIMMVFPFHMKGNPYISPFMIPTVVTSKIYSTSNYIGTGYYKNVSDNSIYVAVSLFIILAIASLITGIICYKKSDVLKNT